MWTMGKAYPEFCRGGTPNPARRGDRPEEGQERQIVLAFEGVLEPAGMAVFQLATAGEGPCLAWAGPGSTASHPVREGPGGTLSRVPIPGTDGADRPDPEHRDIIVAANREKAEAVLYFVRP